MPSLSSLFRHNRKSTPPSTDDAQKNKLKKSRFSTSNLRGLSRAASNNAPPESTPKLPRSSRVSTSVRPEVPEMPEMPAVPIYQTLSSGRHMSMCADNSSRVGGPSREPKQPRRIATIGDFQALEYRKGSILPDTAPPMPEKTPVYDRAVELGKFYRSILPDFQTMFGEDDNTPDDNPNVGGSPKEQRRRGQENTSSDTPMACEAREETSGNRVIPPGVPRDGRPNPARSDSIASSTTAVDSDGLDHIPTRKHRPLGSSARPQSGSAWPLPTPPASPERASQTTAGPTPARAAHVHRGGRDRRSRVIDQHSSASLHVCTDLLIDQLTKALALQRREDGNPGSTNSDEEESRPRQGRSASGNSRQLQVLLLIEAYEGVLRRCKREASSSSSSSSSSWAEGSNAPRDRSGRNGFGDAVPVLEHWLDTLHRLYDDEGFVEDGAD